MKIILSGGGTLGPVVPLLAVAEVYKKNNPTVEFVWVGTKNGPERQIVEEQGIRFITIGAGKWRRYFSLFNFFDIFKIIAAFFQSLLLLLREKPNLLVSTGGFVSVPFHLAGWLLAIPEWVHQQDVQVGLANKLMFPLASKITTATAVTAAALSNRKAQWIGNPSRNLSVRSVEESHQKLGIPLGVPVIFALGGGTGSASINKLVLEALPHWPRQWHIIHLVGKERPHELAARATTVFDNYHVYQFFTEQMKDAYAVADVVIARAGFSTLTELAALSKAAIILPMFGTHQEKNAEMFVKQGGILTLPKGTDTGLLLAQVVKDLVNDPEKRKSLGSTLHSLLPQTKPEKINAIIQELTQ